MRTGLWGRGGTSGRERPDRASRGGTSTRHATRSRGGFTAEELIAVLGVIVLLAIGFFWVTRNVTGMTRMTSCVSNQRQLHHAARMYMADYTGQMAPRDAMPVALEPYTKNQQVFRCPSAEREAHRRGERRAYGWETGNLVVDYDFAHWLTADDPAQALLVRDSEPRHVGRTWLAARLDGAVQRYDGDRFDDAWADPLRDTEGGIADEITSD